MQIVVTSGGTKEKIDNVRNITNSSSGKLGNKIVHEFLSQIDNCNIIYIYGGTAEPIEDDERVENIKIRDTEDLLNVVKDVLTKNKIDIFVHSMAVADYTTSTVIDMDKLKEIVESKKFDSFDDILIKASIVNENKISSNIKSPAILLKQTEKVINYIKKLSPYTFLVGFKLLDNVKEDELFDVGFDLLRKNRCNLVLANDISKIRKGNHRGMLIYPEKTFDIIEGKDKIANFLVKKSIERYNVKHPKSIQESKINNIPIDIFNEFKKMGSLLDVNDYLPRVINHDRLDKVGTYGNLSIKVENGFYITCRNVDKSKLEVEDISYISHVDIKNEDTVYSNVFYNSEIKPSIDTSIHSQIYKYSKFSHIVHIHTNKVFLGLPIVNDSFPCGCDLECNAIVNLVKENPEIDIIQMKKHGLIILGNSFLECLDKIKNLFRNIPCIDYNTHKISKECQEHINDVEPNFLLFENMYPLKLNKRHIGCLYEKIEGNQVHFALYTMELIRGKGYHIVEKYLNSNKEKELLLHTTKACNIAEFYMKKYGFQMVSQKDDSNIVLKR